MPNNYQTHAVMVLYARDADKLFTAFSAVNINGDPTMPPAGDPDYAYLTAANWQALGQLRCDDLFISKGDNCYYGLVLRCTAAIAPFAVGDYLVAVRGTMEPLEWLNDATALIIEDAPGGIGGVGDGFWDVYATMTVCDLTGGNVRPNAAAVIAGMVKAAPGKLYVTGHSLGAALSVFLAADLQKQLAGTEIALAPYFFACPHTGTADYVADYQATVSAYELVNYAADLVPMLPPDLSPLVGGRPRTMSTSSPEARPTRRRRRFRR